MKMSETISSIAAAICEVQGQLDDVVKTELNSHLKSKYANLAGVRAAIRDPLAKNGLAIVQGPRKAEGGVEVETMILHKSGEWISESVFIPVTKNDAHGTGAAITYGRRYGIMALLNIAADDDDGNGAIGNSISNTDNSSARMKAATKIAEKGAEALRVWWSDMNSADRKLFSSDELKQLKAVATTVDQKDSE
jgi:hypothetical protein